MPVPRRISTNRPPTHYGPAGGHGTSSWNRQSALSAMKGRMKWGPSQSVSQAMGAPQVPAAPDPNNPATMPYDALYEDAIARGQRNLSQQLGQIDLQSKDLDRDYNDPTNPFNQLAMAKRAFEQQKAQTTNSAASRGQLYSGALQSQLNEGRFQSERQNDALAQAYARAKQEIAAKRFAANSDFEDYKAGAYGDRISRLGV